MVASYNPTHGGAGDTGNKVIADQLTSISKQQSKCKEDHKTRADKSPYVAQYDYATPYIEDLKNIIDMEAIATQSSYRR